VITYTFDPGTASWVEDAGVVTDDSSQLGDRFGASVAIAGGYMAVGAPGRRIDNAFDAAGSVSIFRWDPSAGVDGAWLWVTRLTRPAGSQLDAAFGTSVDLQYESGVGWTLVVGAPGAFTADGLGETTLFTVDASDDPAIPASWTVEVTLTTPVGSLAFGTSTAISGPYAVVGDPARSGDQGRAYLFERSGGIWSPSPVGLPVFGSGAGAEAGFAVDIEGTTAVIGSPGAMACSVGDPSGCPSGGAVRGEVQVLERVDGTWGLAPAVRSLDDGVGIRFGSAVMLSGGRLAVGAVEGGTIALYGRTATGDWYATSLARATSPAAPGLGGAVAIAPAGRGLLGGWSDDSVVSLDGGSVSRWDAGEDCNGNLLPDACEVLFDAATVDCDGNGEIDSCQIAGAPALDCNLNDILDSCEIAESGSLVDINDNGILDECEGPDCNENSIADAIELRSVEIVWIIDTSVSQSDKFSLVCNLITALEADLDDSDPAVAVYERSRYLTLGSVAPGSLPCSSVIPFETFQDVFGDDLTGLGFPAATPPTFDESWSAATAIAARDNDWRTNLRIVIPISDECGWNNPPECDADDVAAIEAARAVLQCTDVLAFPIQFADDPPAGFRADVLMQMRTLAGEFRDPPPPPAAPMLGTGGQAFSLENATPQLVAAGLADAIRDSLPIHDNDANGILDQCELNPDESEDLNDCNLNLIDDAFEVRSDIGMEAAAPGSPDRPLECFVSCPPDIDGNTTVDFNDLLILLAAYGPCDDAPAPCPADVNQDGAVEFGDLLAVLSTFGPCRTPPPCQSVVAARPQAPASIMECIEKYGTDPVKLQACIEAMILAETP
jgi:hypothetical protein